MSDDIRDQFDGICSAFDKLSLLTQLRDKVSYALEAHRKSCGQCEHWMKSNDCPREKNVNGWNRGPSTNSPICSKFIIKQRSVEIQKSRAAEAIEFARKYDLPIPDHLSVESPNDKR